MMSISCSRNQYVIFNTFDFSYKHNESYPVDYFNSKSDEEKMKLLFTAVLSKNFLKINENVRKEFSNNYYHLNSKNEISNDWAGLYVIDFKKQLQYIYLQQYATRNYRWDPEIIESFLVHELMHDYYKNILDPDIKMEYIKFASDYYCIESLDEILNGDPNVVIKNIGNFGPIFTRLIPYIKTKESVSTLIEESYVMNAELIYLKTCHPGISSTDTENLPTDLPVESLFNLYDYNISEDMNVFFKDIVSDNYLAEATIETRNIKFGVLHK